MAVSLCDPYGKNILRAPCRAALYPSLLGSDLWYWVWRSDCQARHGLRRVFSNTPYGLTWPAAPTTLRGLVSSTGTRQNWENRDFRLCADETGKNRLCAKFWQNTPHPPGGIHASLSGRLTPPKDSMVSPFRKGVRPMGGHRILGILGGMG